MTAVDIQFNVSSDREADIRNMVWKYEHMWSRKPEEINITEIRHDLVPDAKYDKSLSHRTSPKTQELENDEIDKELKAGVTEPFMLECSARCCFSKKDEKLRFFVDYIKLNTITVNDMYPLQCMDELIDAPGDAQ